jgi:hypothetical protein
MTDKKKSLRGRYTLEIVEVEKGIFDIRMQFDLNRPIENRTKQFIEMRVEEKTLIPSTQFALSQLLTRINPEIPQPIVVPGAPQ